MSSPRLRGVAHPGPLHFIPFFNHLTLLAESYNLGVLPPIIHLATKRKD